MSTASATRFRVNVHDLVGRPGQMREVSFAVRTPEKWGEGLIAVPAESDLELELRLESVHEGILVSGEAHGTAAGECGRCLIDIEQPVEVDFQELFAYSSDEACDFEVEADHVDLEPLVRDAVVLSLPFQPVCRPDCPGLDPETGERLADHPERMPSAAPDPRWAALAELASEHNTDDRHDDAGADQDREER